MTKITISQLIEYYYEEDLCFVDIMKLFSEKKIALKDGIVSQDDLQVIITEKKLPSLDRRDFKEPKQPKKQDEAEEEYVDPEELEKIITHSEKAIYKLEKEGRKNGGNDRELCKEYEILCDAYEKLQIFSGRRVSPERALHIRVKFKKLLEQTETADKYQIADNLLKLGQLYFETRNYTGALHNLNDARYLLEELLNEIKILELREKSEVSAKLGLTHQVLYMAKKKIPNERNGSERHLELAERFLAAYTCEKTTSPYYDCLVKVRKELEKCRKE